MIRHSFDSVREDFEDLLDALPGFLPSLVTLSLFNPMLEKANVLLLRPVEEPS